MAIRPTVRLALIAAALAGLQAPAFAMDLTQAYQAALANDAIVASARSQLDAVRQKVTQARAGLLPGVSAASSISYQVSDTSAAPSREFTSQNYSVQLSYPLYRLQNIETWEQSKLQVAIANAQLGAAQQDLMLRVSQAYFDVLTAQDNLATIGAQKRAISEQLASAKRNFEVGTATITDQQEAQARYDLTLAQEVVAQNDIQTRQAALALLIGKPAPALNTLRPEATLELPGSSNEKDWTETARKNNLTVQQASLAAEIARREIDKQRYANRPTLDLVGNLGHSRSSSAQFIGVSVNAASVGVQFAMPLYAGGAIDARVREAIALQAKSQSDLENARRQADQAARAYFLGLSSGLAQVNALKAAEKSSQLALDSNQLGYQVGVRINIDVLNAQQQLYTTRRDLAKARYEVLLNGLRLKASVGELAEKDLARAGALMQAASNR
ncbi:MAG: TolC family outer membrane protein [Quisquiliibacterium sp.]